VGGWVTRGMDGTVDGKAKSSLFLSLVSQWRGLSIKSNDRSNGWLRDCSTIFVLWPSELQAKALTGGCFWLP
jgi:hypothetical protein